MTCSFDGPMAPEAPGSGASPLGVKARSILRLLNRGGGGIFFHKLMMK